MSIVSELARKLAAEVPDAAGSLGTMRGDLEGNFHAMLDSAIQRMDLVTREEFDIQRKVLERTRAKLTALEAQVALFEAKQFSDSGANKTGETKADPDADRSSSDATRAHNSESPSKSR